MSRLPLVAFTVLAIAAVAACSSGSAPGWTYAPAPAVTPAPSASGSAEPSASGGASPSASAGSSASPSESAEPSASGGADVLTVTATDGAATSGFEPEELEAPADTAFTVVFDNQDTTTSPHNWVLKDATGAKVDIGDTAFFSAGEKREYQVPALAAGDYPFVCEVHAATMTGTLTVK
jgi:plastocyanin